MSIPNMTDQELGDQYATYTKLISEMRAQMADLEAEIHRRLIQANARELIHPSLRIALVEAGPSYDLDSLMPKLKEILPPAIVDDAYTPQHEVTTVVVQKLNMVKARFWPERYGNEVKEAFDKARIPGAVRLVIEPLKTGVTK